MADEAYVRTKEVASYVDTSTVTSFFSVAITVPLSNIKMTCGF
jgi:hypothetical protein